MGGERISVSEVEELKGELPLWNQSETDVTVSCLLTLVIKQLKLSLDIALR
jgi:hypothetical protein